MAKKSSYFFMFVFLSLNGSLAIAHWPVEDEQVLAGKLRPTINGNCKIISPITMNYVVVDGGKLIQRTGKLKNQFKVDTDIAFLSLEPTTATGGKISPILAKVALVFQGRKWKESAGKRIFYWLINGKSNSSTLYQAQINLTSPVTGAEVLPNQPSKYVGSLIYKYELPVLGNYQFTLECSFDHQKLHST